MIARLHGVLHEKTPEQLIVDVGGVGYQVLVSLQTFYHLPGVGEQVSLLIHTHTREDTLQLFGFLEEKEKLYFLLLRSVSGIGPRLALNILSGISVDELETALHARDVTRLVATPGVGKKTAERLVVELQEKVGAGKRGAALSRKRPVHSRLKRSLLWCILAIVRLKRSGRCGWSYRMEQLPLQM